MDGRVEVSSGAVIPGANGFGYFPRKESNPRRWTAREKTWTSNIKVTGSRQTAAIHGQELRRRGDEHEISRTGEKEEIRKRSDQSASASSSPVRMRIT